ncbi:MAG: hypothetical protein V1784_06565 [bacterium]
MVQGRGYYISAALLCVLLVPGISVSGDLSIQGGVIFPPGFCIGAGWEFKPLAGHFLLPEISVVYAQAEAPVEAAPSAWPGSVRQEYDYSGWSNAHAIGRLKLQGIVPHSPFCFALGVGAGPHFVGAESDYEAKWNYQWQLRGHGFVQVNVRLDRELSIYTEIEGASDFRSIQNPQKFPQGFLALKLGLRFHSIGSRT